MTHVTRYSDSSHYDERCILCHGTDALGDHSLKGACPVGHAYAAQGHDIHSKDDRIVRCKTCGGEGGEGHDALSIRCTPAVADQANPCAGHTVRHTPRAGWQDKVANDLVDRTPLPDVSWKAIGGDEPYTVEDVRVVVRPRTGESVVAVERECVLEITGDVQAYFENQKAYFEIVGKAPNELLQLLKFMKVDVKMAEPIDQNAFTTQTPYGEVYGSPAAIHYVRELTEADVALGLQQARHRNFREELTALINSHSLENGSDTPDFVLANYLIGALSLFEAAVRGRCHGHAGSEGSGSPLPPGTAAMGAADLTDMETHH